MNPAELRIGNYIEYNKCILPIIGIASPKPVDGRFADKWVIELLCNGFINATLDQLIPIPLTEEWLLKLGFIDEALECRNERIHKTYRSGELILDERFILMDIDTKVEVKYIHQLQNLFYALTGEELKLQIPE
ncbi:hypothetical protein [Elizabethkingia anophelis]|uniref:hypothetical protein n=1 Tax=Elizabethkingia anophelis TaxID=1117645 RepID=UPI00162468C6|nr:hypothetical protein [Elizabethkingia anophelis]